MGDWGREEDGRLEEARDKVKWRRNVASVLYVHMSTSEGMFLRVEISGVLVWLIVEENMRPTEYIFTEKYLRGGRPGPPKPPLKMLIISAFTIDLVKERTTELGRATRQACLGN